MKPYQNQKSSKKKQVEKMFDSISFEYDKLNRLMYDGNDVKWRKNIYKIAERLRPVNILDIATGTADIALELSQIKDSEIIGLDISEKMLDEKVDDILQTEAQLVLGGDLGCLMNIAGRLTRRGSEKEVRHIAEVLADMTHGPGIGAPETQGN